MISTALLTLMIPQGPPGWSSQLPVAASTFTKDHDGLFYFTYYMSVFFFVLITGVLVYSVIKYRRKTEDQPPASLTTHHTALEVTWTVVPLILVMIIFAWGWKGMRDMVLAPAEAKPYEVEAWRWAWRFKHPPPDGQRSSPLDWALKPEFFVVKGEPAVFNMRSKDVLHSLYIPAFRVKRDVLPGRYQRIWFTADREGTYPVFCTEDRGTNHSRMTALVHVVSKEVYAKTPWRILPTDPVKRGEVFYQSNCASCHSTEKDVIVVGPSFRDLYGSEEVLEDGTKQKVDDEYIVESIREPQKKRVKGYEGKVMNTFGTDVIDDKYIPDIILYLKSLSKHSQ